MRTVLLLALLGAPAFAADGFTPHLKVIGFLRSEQALIRAEDDVGNILLYRLDFKTGKATEEETIVDVEENDPKSRASRWAAAEKKYKAEGFVIDGKHKPELALSLPGGVIISVEKRNGDEVLVAKQGKKKRDLISVSSPVVSDPIWLDEVRLTPDRTAIIVLVGGTMNVLSDSMQLFTIADLFKGC